MNAGSFGAHGKVELGSELAVGYSQIREHKKPILAD